jgi:hypothetical protein
MVLSRLFSDWVGLLSFIVIAFTVVMGIWFSWFFNRKMDESAARDAGDGASGGSGR